MRWRSWLKHCATRQKVAGSILYCMILIFYEHNSSCRTMVLGLFQPLTEMSTRNISWKVKVAELCREILGFSNSWNPLGLYVIPLGREVLNTLF
jgi:hypothetical protein